MKKSQAVPATLCAAIAAIILEGCSNPTSVRRCVDPATGTLLPDNACSNPITASSFRGGRYILVPDGTGQVCIDSQTNQSVARSMCTSGHVGPGYYHMGRYYRPGWGYDGVVNNGRVQNFTASPKNGADVKSSSGRVISRGGLGSTGSSGGSSFG